MFKWQRHGGYEVSSKGDARFSAFRAILEDGRSIEEHYQCDVKGYDPGGTNWRSGKGKPPRKRMSEEELYGKYLDLWRQWSNDNPHMIEVLRIRATEHGKILSDRFASSPVNQARALCDTLNQ